MMMTSRDQHQHQHCQHQRRQVVAGALFLTVSLLVAALGVTVHADAEVISNSAVRRERMWHPALIDERLHGSNPALAITRRVSYWMSAGNQTANANMLKYLESQGGREVATSVFLYCGSSINDTGAFISRTGEPGCKQVIAGLHAMNIGVEPEIGISLAALRLIASNATIMAQTINALEKDVLDYNLQGVAWDVEPKGSNYEDCVAFSQYLAAQAAVLNQHGARVTTYSNSYDEVIKHVNVLAGGANLVTGGETYNGQTFDEWLLNYFLLVNNQVPHAKVSCGMLASTERGNWNCESSTMQQRIDRMFNDTLVEFSVFVLRDPSDPGNTCTTEWIPYAREWIKTPFLNAAEHIAILS